MPEVGFDYIFIPIKLIDFILGKDGKRYPQVILKECKYMKNDDKIYW